MTETAALNAENTGVSRQDLRGAMFASIVGNILEWYDFFIYGTASALVFGTLFFPVGEDPLINTLVAFVGYSVGFFARPLGGLIFGHVGDRFGRKAALVWTLTIMGFAAVSARKAKKWKPRVIVLGKGNKIVDKRGI